MTKTSRKTNPNPTTSVGVVIADANTAMVHSDEQNRNENGRPSQTCINGQEDAIRRLAYQKWEAAGCPAGDGTEFWLDAEHESKVE